MLSYWPKLLYPYYSLLLFSRFSSLSIGWYCGAGVFGLMECVSLSFSLALPTFFNNNNTLLLVLKYSLFFAPNTHCALVVALSEKTCTIQYVYRKCGTHALVFSQAFAHGNIKNEIR